MHAPVIVGIVAAVAALALVTFILSTRRRRDDLGSVSSAWTTQHSVGYRGDGSTN
jgi:preprotein translocase subunit SecG